MSDIAHGTTVRQSRIAFYRKLWDIHEAVERIEKDKHNQQGGYQYASEKAIKEALHPLFVKHGLLLVPTKQDLVNFTPPQGDKKSYITTIKCAFTIVDLENGEDLPIEILASGGDSLDKGTFKAITGGIKYALTTMFLIPTGDDPEDERGGGNQRQRPQMRQQQRQQQDPEEIISEPQQKRLFAIVRSAGFVNAEETKGRISSVIFDIGGYDSMKQIRAKHYDAICAELQKQKGTIT